MEASSNNAWTGQDQQDVLLCIGTFTEQLPYVSVVGPGLVLARFDPVTRRFSVEKTVAGLRNPTYLAISSCRSHLYAVCETEDFESRSGGGVAALRLGEVDGHPSLLNSQPTGGATPCHLAIVGAGRWLAVANYGGGSVSVLEVRPDGTLGGLIAVCQHQGSGPVLSRQESPHPHMVLPTDGDLLYVPDLGTDTVVVYQLDAPTGTITQTGAIALPPGSGPRHMAMHPSRSFAFVVGELDSTVTCLQLRGGSGQVRARVSTLPESYPGVNAPSGIVVDHVGNFVYVANRGHDSVTVLRFDAGRGVLEPWQNVGSGGTSPRDVVLSPSGDLLFVVNQTSNNVVAFGVDSRSGRLSPLGAVRVGAPACALVLDAPLGHQ